MGRSPWRVIIALALLYQLQCRKRKETCTEPFDVRLPHPPATTTPCVNYTHMMSPEAAALFASKERNHNFSSAAPTAAARQQAWIPPAGSSSSNGGGEGVSWEGPAPQSEAASLLLSGRLNVRTALQIHFPEWRPVKTGQGTFGKGRWMATKGTQSSFALLLTA